MDVANLVFFFFFFFFCEQVDIANLVSNPFVHKDVVLTFVFRKIDDICVRKKKKKKEEKTKY
jgi:hypothetical protein